MDMILNKDFLEMNSMEMEEVNGGALNELDVMYVSPNTTAISQLYLPIGVSVVRWAIATALSMFQKYGAEN